LEVWQLIGEFADWATDNQLSIARFDSGARSGLKTVKSTALQRTNRERVAACVHRQSIPAARDTNDNAVYWKYR
jgi:hypothetical protein